MSMESGTVGVPARAKEEALLPIPHCSAGGCRQRGLIGRGHPDGSVTWWCEGCFSTALVREERKV